MKKVILLAAKDIDKSKIVIGVPTYGYEYDMFNALDGSGEIEYSNLWSFNPGYATDTALKLQIAPMRNSAGELFLTYPASRSLDPSIPLPFATRVMSWSDAEAIRQKAELAEKLGVRGIALFKIDGGQDAGLWNVLAQYKNKSMAFVPATISVNTTDTSVINVSGKPGVVAPSRNLYFGIIGEDVRTLQKFLNERGFSVSTTGGGSPGNETKYFGPATVRALTLFKRHIILLPLWDILVRKPAPQSNCSREIDLFRRMYPHFCMLKR